MAAGKPRGDEAVGSSVVAFLIAGVLFMASVVAVLVTTRNSSAEDSTGDATEVARFDIQAASLADILLQSPGYFHDGVNPGVSPLDWAHDAGYNGETANADRMDRLGLLDPNDPAPFMMDFEKFQNLRRAGYYANSTDKYVNYLEAATTLGLADAGLDFHLRAYPTLDSVADLLAANSKDRNLRVTYVGDIEVQTTTFVANQSLSHGLNPTTPVCTIDPSNPKAYVVSTTVTNGEAIDGALTQFTAVTTIDLGGGNRVQTQNINGFTVAPGTSVTLSVEVAAVNGRSCDGTGKVATFDIYDPVHAKLVTAPALAGGAFASSPGTAAETPIGLFIDTDKQNYRPTEDVVLNYDGYSLNNNNDLFLRVCPGTTECTTAAAVYASPGGNTFEATTGNNNNPRRVDVGTLPVGEYTAWLYDCQSIACGSPASPGSSHLHVTEKILVTAAPVAGYVPPGTIVLADPIYTAPAGPEQEVLFLETLITKFCPTWFYSDDGADSPLTGVDWDDRCASPAVGSFKIEPAGQTQPGDVFPDSKKVMNEDLPARLLCPTATCPVGGIGGVSVNEGQPRYDLTNVLVIGSGVDHSAMTSDSAKGAIRDWVHGGGTIVVFGSDEGNVNWLQPLFHSAIRGGGGSISTPDQGHPMLHTPNELDNPGANYDARDSAWRFNGQTARAQDDPNTAVFSNVVVVDGDETTGDPLLALSNKGSFGSGSIIITAFMPYDIYGPAQAATSGQPAGADCPGRTMRECEGMKFMHNLLMQGYADLFLDYGPVIPEETNVQPSQRLTQIRHPQFIQPIELTMIVYVF